MTSLPEVAAAPAWIWFAAGLALCAVEVFMPGVFLLWFELAALAVGLVTLWLPLGFVASLTLFAAAAVGAVLVGRAVYGARTKNDDADALNRGAEEFVGREFILDSAIENGVGHIKVRDLIWRVEGPSAPAGARVRVVGVANGVVPRVELVSASAETQRPK